MINFIQLGANVGKSMSDMMWWLAPEMGWNGIFVEPVPECFDKLTKCYENLTGSYFEPIAIIPDPAPPPKKELGLDHGNQGFPLDREGKVLIHQTGKTGEQSSIVRGAVPTGPDEFLVDAMTLLELVVKYDMAGQDFDLLITDVEKLDYDIIMTTDFDLVKPKYIKTEVIHNSKNQNKSLAAYLGAWGYEKIPDPWYSRYVEMCATVTTENFGTNFKAEKAKYNAVYKRKK